MAADDHALLFQKLAAHRPSKHHAGGEPSGKMTAAPNIVGIFVPHRSRIVGVTRPGVYFQFTVILGARVGVLDYRRQRRSGEYSIQQAGKNVRDVTFFAGRGAFVAPRRTAGHLIQYRIKIKGFPGGQAVNHHANGFGMAPAENGQLYVVSPSG